MSKKSERWPLPKFKLHLKSEGWLEVTLPLKNVSASQIQVRVSYYERSSDGKMIGQKQTLDTTKGDLIAEIEMWEQ
jgi:hypothetical protein